MSDTDETKRCARCGAEFTPSSSPLGVCPSCLLKLGMSDPAVPAGPSGPALHEDVAPIGPALHDEVNPKRPTLRDTVTVPAGSKGPASRLRLLRRVSIAIAALLVIVVGTIFSRFLMRPTQESNAAPHAQAVRFTLTLPDGMQIPEAAQFAVSADGTQVVVAARGHESGMPRLWLRRLQSLEWRELPRTDGAAFPFWSPDGRHIGFFAGSRVKRIDIGNDLTETICDAANGRGGTWSTQ